MSDNPSTTCVRDAHGNCSRWCDHVGARPGEPRNLATTAPEKVEHLSTLAIGAKIKYLGGEFDVNNIVIRHGVNDRINNEQTVDLTVVLTRPIVNLPEEKS